MEKMAQLDLSDQVYNWLVAFFTEHTHCTLYHWEMPAFLTINASIIQGSAIGPSSNGVNAADFKVAIIGNAMIKFADDTYIVIPSTNVNSQQAEVDHSASWNNHGRRRTICKSTKKNTRRLSSKTGIAGSMSEKFLLHYWESTASKR